jgi:large subunit ribosomal protein L31e
MAAEKDSIERIVTIPLRAGCLKKARNDRTKRAIYEIKQYALRHTDAEEVKVSKLVNELLWQYGIQKPPNKLKVKLSVSEGVAKVMLPDEKEEPKEEKKGAAATLKDRLIGKHPPAKAEPAPKEEAKPEAKGSADKEKPAEKKK